MLVYVIPTSYPNEDNPIANCFIYEQVKALSANGCKIVVLNVQKQPLKRFFKRVDGKVHVKTDNYSTIIYKKQKTLFEKQLVGLNQILFDHSMRKLFLLAINKYGKPDVIYAHFFGAACSTLRITQHMGIPIVALEHSGLLTDRYIGVQNMLLLKYVVKNVNEYIATTYGLKQHVIKHTNTKRYIRVIPNMIDDMFRYYPNERTKFTFFSLARFDFDKRIDLLVKSFCNAFSVNDNVVLRIGGNGKEFQNIKKVISSKNREGQITLLDRLNREEVLQEMISCSCFVLPSRHETFGIAWREALSVGRPVITTNHGGFCEEDWSNTFGIMIPVDSEDDLKNAMQEMVNNYESYDLKKISEENVKMYAANNIAKKIIKIFNDLLEQKK